jgi:hypothetical protein
MTTAVRHRSQVLGDQHFPIGHRRPVRSALLSYGVLNFVLFQCRWIIGEARLCRI